MTLNESFPVLSSLKTTHRNLSIYRWICLNRKLSKKNQSYQILIFLPVAQGIWDRKEGLSLTASPLRLQLFSHPFPWQWLTAKVSGQKTRVKNNLEKIPCKRRECILWIAGNRFLWQISTFLTGRRYFQAFQWYTLCSIQLCN